METKKTILTDLDVISGSTSTIFTGLNDDLINLPVDPIVNGYAFWIWLDLPSWFQDDPDLKYFKDWTEKNMMAFQGVGATELTTATHQTGFAGHEFDVVTGVQRGNNEFTITHKEFSQGIMRKLYQKWENYVRDPRTGIAIYPKLFGVEYGARNHTGQGMYIVVRPDVTNTAMNIVEYACFYSNVFPTNIPLDSLYNFSIGQQESPTIDITYKGFAEMGPDVEAYAQTILRDKIIKNSENSGNLAFIDGMNSDPDTTALFKSGTISDIYNS